MNSSMFAHLQDGYTPLDEAFRNCTLPVAEFLMGVNADVNNVKKIMEKDRVGSLAIFSCCTKFFSAQRIQYQNHSATV